EIRQQWQVGAVALYLWEEEGKRLTRYPRGGDMEDGVVTDASGLEPLLHQVVSSNQVLVDNDIQRHGAAGKETTGNLTDGSAHNLAAAPLATRDGVVGVLALINKEDGGFNDDDVTLLRAFS